jgi:TRAP transporter TAXI family solute receptor
MKSIARHLTTVSMGVLLSLALAAPAPAAQYINVLTGGTSGIYYPLGVALTSALSEALPNAHCATQSTKASVENLNLLQIDRGEVAFTLGDSLADAWAGDAEAGFKKPLTKLRGISALYSNYIQIVARADSGIKTLADLKGKRVSVGAPKSGTELDSRTIIHAAGMSYDDFAKVEYLSYGQSVELIKNRQLDAAMLSAGLGVSALRDLASTTKVVFVSIPADVIAKTGKKSFVADEIPAGTYDGQKEAVPTAAIINFLVTRSDLDDNTVYTITKTLYTHLDQLIAAHAAAKKIKLQNAIKHMPVPLHPGAERYYREVGLIK